MESALLASVLIAIFVLATQGWETHLYAGSAIGPVPAKVTVKWIREVKKIIKIGLYDQSVMKDRETASFEAVFRLEIPNVDYFGEPFFLYTFAYGLGQTTATQYMDGPGKRQELPQSKLVSIAGEVAFSVDQLHTYTRTEGGEATIPTVRRCEARTQMKGGGPFTLGQYGSFQLNIFGRGASVDVVSSKQYPLTIRETSSCSNPNKHPPTERSVLAKWPALIFPLVVPLKGCKVDVTPSTRRYSGSAYCEHHTTDKFTVREETSLMDFTLEMGAGR